MLVALTGGIATGKSTACEAFEALGVPVVDADLIAREVVAPGEPALADIRAHFGDDILGPDGGLDRARLRSRVFADPAERAALEKILHPRIRYRMFERARSVTAPYCILAIPLLVEGGLSELLDRIVVVDAPPESQRERLAARDGSSPEEIDRILSSQATREDRLAVADDVLDNSGTLEELKEQVTALHRKLQAEAREHS